MSHKNKVGDMYEKRGFKTFAKTGDIYCLFYEKGLNLLKDNGILTYITSNKWMRAAYGEKLRKFLAQYNPINLIDFAGQKVFESATVDVNILICQKSKNQGKTMACTANDLCKNNLSVFVQQYSEKISFTNYDSWIILSAIEQGIQQKIISKGVPLKQWNISINFGIKTGFNDAFVIDTNTKNRLIEDDPKSAEIIRPILRGRDIGRYECNYANLWLIATFPSKNYDIDDYPAVKTYLLSFGKERLEQTGKTFILNGETIQSRKKTNNKWFETQDSISYWDDFSKQKIVWKRIGSKLRFSYDDKGLFCLDSTCFATGKHIKFLSAVLNTYIGNFLFKDSPKTGTGDLLISVQAFDPIRIPLPTPEQEDVVSGLLDKLLLNINSEYGKQLDEEINNYICTIYGFSDEEKSYIKSYVNRYYR